MRERKKEIWRGLIWGLAFLIFQSINAQDPNFRIISTLDGLNNGTINSISQDEFGNIWMATWDGLMKYDGYTVNTYLPVLNDSTSLPARRVNEVMTDSDGNVWSLTTKGFCMYDKKYDRFIRFGQEIDLEVNGIPRGIFEMNHVLYVRYSKGFYYYLALDSFPGMTTFKRVNWVGIEESMLDRTLNYDVDRQQEVFLCQRSDNGAGNYTSSIFSAKNTKNNPGEIAAYKLFDVDDGIYVICSDGADRIFTGSPTGLYVYYRSENKIEEVSGAKGLNVRNMHITVDQRLWIATNGNGLAVMDLHTGEIKRFLHDPGRANTLAGNVIYSLFEDFSGHLWVGHGGEGVSILNLLNKPFETFRMDPNDAYSLSDNTVFCFNETNREILVGTNFDGLNFMKYDNQLKKPVFTKAKFPDEFTADVRFNAVWHIAKEDNNEFWLGTNFGLIFARKQSGKWNYQRFLQDENTGTIRQVFIDSNENLWVGSYNGIFLIPASGRDRMKPFVYKANDQDFTSLSDNVISAFLLDRKGNFWIGTQDGGINLLKTKYRDLDMTGRVRPLLQFTRFTATSILGNGLNNNEINCLYEHSDGSIWAGTQGGGINRIDPDTRGFTYLTTDHGLPGNDVFSILPDNKGMLWISTNKGLSSYDPDEEIFTNYSPEDGIQGNVFMVNSYFKGEDGKLYFGGRRGFTSFYPDNISYNNVPPRISFTGMEVFQEKIEIGQELNGNIILPMALPEVNSVKLSYRESDFSILFSATHFQHPRENRVEYQLEGYNERWIELPASRGRLNFSNLPPETYTLKVRAANSDNVWTSEIKQLGVVITPPWWETLLARILFALLLISALTGLILLLLHRQRLQHNLKMEIIEKQNIKELNETKLRFFTNISHELRTPLSLTLAPVEELLSKKENLSPQATRLLSMASRNSKILLRLINQIIDFRKANAGKLTLSASESDLGRFLLDLKENFESYRKDKRINLHLDIPDEPFLLWFDHKRMEQIIYNLLSNAYKYTCVNGNVSISLHKARTDSIPDENNREWAELTFFNDGAVIPADQLERIFERFHKLDNDSPGSGIGLSLVKSLVELHHGSVKASSESESGVSFSVFLPLGENHLSNEEKQDNIVKVENEVSHSQAALEPVPSFIPEGEGDKELSLLVVEDNSELRSFFRTHFEKDYNFYEAPDGEKGMELAERYVPDLIICDIMMPGMNGFKVCENIKESIQTSHIPVILLTAKSSEEHKIVGYSSGADAYVVKPFEIKVLDSQIKQLIKNREKLRESYHQQNYSVESRGGEGPSTEDRFLVKTREIIEENLLDPDFNVNQLSQKLFISSTQLYRKVKALTGHSSVEFIRIIRLVKASELVLKSQHSVKEICYMTGFNNPSYFIKCFKEHYGKTPSEYTGKVELSGDGARV